MALMGNTIFPLSWGAVDISVASLGDAMNNFVDGHSSLTCRRNGNDEDDGAEAIMSGDGVDGRTKAEV